MSKLDLHIVTKGAVTTPNDPFRTCTMIRKEKDNEKLVFHNDSTALLTITINRLDVLCDTSGTLLTSKTFDVVARSHKTFKIHDACPQAAELKYTAEIVGAAREDPIIIIER